MQLTLILHIFFVRTLFISLQCFISYLIHVAKPSLVLQLAGEVIGTSAQCSPLPTLPDSTNATTVIGEAVPGTFVYMECDNGKTLGTGHKKSMCNRHGEWTHADKLAQCQGRTTSVKKIVCIIMKGFHNTQSYHCILSERF